MISQMSATPLESSDASLVAGNVTGGGGKATTKKNLMASYPRVQQDEFIQIGC
jgi:hypothetical protein